MTTPTITYDAVSDQLRQQNREGLQSKERVRCPLCDVRRAKRFRQGRGLRMHLLQKHASEVDSAAALAAVMDRAELEVASEIPPRPGKRKRKRDEERPNGNLEDELLCAAKKGDKETFLDVARQMGDQFALMVRDRHGASVLDWAAGGGHLGLLDKLLEMQRAVDPKVQPPKKRRRRKDGRSALHWAARNGHVEVIKMLLRHVNGPEALEPVLFESIDEEAYDGTTPLMLALFGGHLDAAEFLVEHGASIVHENKWRCTTSHWAAMGGSVQCLEWLWKRHGGGSELLFSRLQKEGHTPLHKAAQKGQLTACKWLLQRLPNVEQTTTAGSKREEGPRQEFKEKRENDECENVEKSDTKDVKGSSRLRPSQLALAGGYTELAQFLLENGL